MGKTNRTRTPGGGWSRFKGPNRPEYLFFLETNKFGAINRFSFRWNFGRRRLLKRDGRG